MIHSSKSADRGVCALHATLAMITNRMYGKVNYPLNLPKTKFPIKPNYKSMDEKYRDAVINPKYSQPNGNLNAKKQFTLIDGPPFANGPLHIGHALNKMLKDTILRFKLKEGYSLNFTPSWDCHGLPIEQKALEALGATTSPLDIRVKSQKIANAMMSRQRKTMQDWACLGSHNTPILTMQPSYERQQLQIFAQFVEKQLVYREKRPIFWSPTLETALAEAEIVYKPDHCSKSVLLKFRVKEMENVWALCWSSAPWTCWANQAIAYNPKANYVLVAFEKADKETEKFIVNPKSLLWLQKYFALDFRIIGPFSFSPTLSYESINGEAGAFIAADWVEGGQPSIDSHSDMINDQVVGSGLVHIAPSYGSEDYACWKSFDQKRQQTEVEIINGKGLFIAGKEGEKQRRGGRVPAILVGKSIFDTESMERALLDSPHALINASNPRSIFADYVHKYPLDWRSGEPCIQMATPQLFIDLSNIKGNVIHTINEGIRMQPPSAKQTLIKMLHNRQDWCISRQRTWGLPIPVFYKNAFSTCNDQRMVIDPMVIQWVSQLFGKHGSSVWWKWPVDDLLPPQSQWRGQGLVKGMDTFDVWFDSGCMWSAQRGLSADGEDKDASSPNKADGGEGEVLAIEGIDQCRGWFQSTLITHAVQQYGGGGDQKQFSLGHRHEDDKMVAPPFTDILTHGFALDAQGMKQSKSKGNVTDPSALVANKPLDLLRLWAVSQGSQWGKDCRIGVEGGGEIAAQLMDLYGGVRNAFRFIIANLEGSASCPSALDKSILDSCNNAAALDTAMVEYSRGCFQKIREHFSLYALHSTLPGLKEWLINANLYFECIKNRLYLEAPGSAQRRSAVHCLGVVGGWLRDCVIPVLPTLVAEVDDHTDFGPFIDGYNRHTQHSNKGKRSKSTLPDLLRSRNLIVEGIKKLNLRRTETVMLTPDHIEVFSNFADKNLLLEVSQCARIDSIPPVAPFSLKGDDPSVLLIDDPCVFGKMYLRRAQAEKCERCWRWIVDDSAEICPTCSHQIRQFGCSSKNITRLRTINKD